jgi:gamma-D-glutamyl-L-lysine dipeptidyl-peptidase
VKRVTGFVVALAVVATSMVLAGVPRVGAATTGDVASPREHASAKTTARWVAVGVATLWVEPTGQRTVDRLTVDAPATVRSWITSMTVSQKRWLVGRVETQVLYGTAVTVVTTRGGWSRVAVASQPTPRDRRGYPGWIPTWQLTSRRPTPTTTVAVVSTPTTWIDASATGSRHVIEVSYDTRLPALSVSSTAVRVSLLDGRTGYVRRAAVVVRRSDATTVASYQQVVAQARKFLGRQYLWGGTSGFGFDCSGFTYSVMRFLGVTIPRDAAPQATAGTVVDRRSLRPGDLVFFRDSTGGVVHVAIFVGSPGGIASVIHSPDTGQSITITPLSSWSTSSYAGARRYLP